MKKTWCIVAALAAVVNEITDYGTSVGASILQAAKTANIPAATQPTATLELAMKGWH